MALADYEKATAVVDEFQGLLCEHRDLRAYLAKIGPSPIGGVAHRSPHPDEEPTRDALRKLNDEILRLQPLVEDIARHIDPEGDPEGFEPDASSSFGWRWAQAMESTQRLIGRLRDVGLRFQILGPKGPLLAANQLHPWVWNAAVDRWASGHWADAVGAAARAVEEMTQQKTGLSSTGGAGLFSLLFSTEPAAPDKPRLRFAEIAEKSGDGKTSQKWTSAHEGAAAFGRGCAQGIRNMQAHGTAELSEQEAIEYLAALSVLARWVDAATFVAPAQPAA